MNINLGRERRDDFSAAAARGKSADHVRRERYASCNSWATFPPTPNGAAAINLAIKAKAQARKAKEMALIRERMAEAGQRKERHEAEKARARDAERRMLNERLASARPAE